MANPWFRMYAEFSHDPKVQIMQENMQRRYVMIMCLRCSGDVTLHETELAFFLRISDAELAETKALFISKGFIDDSWNILNWDKRQFSSDSSAERVARHRERKKQEGNGDVTLHETKGNALDTDTDTDTEIKDANASSVGKDNADRKADDCPHQKIIDAYHELLPTGIQVKVWNGTRAKHLKARWREDSKRQTIDWWRRLFSYIAQSPFLTGKVHDANKPPFEISLEWIVNPTNIARIIEGKYHREAA